MTKTLEDYKKEYEAELKQKFRGIAKTLKIEYSCLVEIFKDKWSFSYNSLYNMPDFPQKELAENTLSLRDLCIAVGREKFVNFLEFTKANTNICRKIDQIFKENNTNFNMGNSYIIISKSRNILNNLPSWIILTQTSSDRYVDLKCNFFNFIELAKDLERYERNLFNNDDEELAAHLNIGGKFYYDFIHYPTGYLFANENSEKEAYVRINNRMLKLMEKNKSMIILTPKPMSFFENQINEGVENLHIIDLRPIENMPIGTVEME